MLIDRSRGRRSAARRGASLVELMIGLAVGLFVVVGGLSMFAFFTHDNRLLLQETRIAQDLRAAADLVARDLRRAGYWDASTSGIWSTGMTGTPPQNAYAMMAGSACSSATLDAKSPAGSSTAPLSALCYAIAQDTNNTIDTGDRFGFELDGGVIYYVLGGNRQALTDPKTITITHLDIIPTSQVLPAASFCSKTCTSNCPEVVVREFEILIRGQLPGDASVSRFLRSNVRVRNDYLGGQCPT